MTNWCDNRFEIEGSAVAIAAFKQRCFERDEFFSLDLAFPPPPAVRELHDNIRYGPMGPYGELGVAALMNSEAALVSPQLNPILKRKAVKSAGIESFADLKGWLRKNQPKALELGAKAVEAYEKTGSCFARDWKIRNWGTRAWIHSSLDEETDNRLVISFATAWSAPEPFYRELARLFPELVLRAWAAEQGLGFAYRFCSEGGVITEEELPWSREFMASMGIEVDEEGNEIFDDPSEVSDPERQNVKIAPSDAVIESQPQSVSMIMLASIYGILLVLAGAALIPGAVMLWKAWHDQETYGLIAQHGASTMATFRFTGRNSDSFSGDLEWWDSSGAARRAETLLSRQHYDLLNKGRDPSSVIVRIKYLVEDAQARPVILDDEAMREQIIARNYEWGALFVAAPLLFYLFLLVRMRPSMRRPAPTFKRS